MVYICIQVLGRRIKRYVLQKINYKIDTFIVIGLELFVRLSSYRLLINYIQSLILRCAMFLCIKKIKKYVKFSSLNYDERKYSHRSSLRVRHERIRISYFQFNDARVKYLRPTTIMRAVFFCHVEIRSRPNIFSNNQINAAVEKCQTRLFGPSSI